MNNTFNPNGILKKTVNHFILHYRGQPDVPMNFDVKHAAKAKA